jgi:dienelactone hydrolase
LGGSDLAGTFFADVHLRLPGRRAGTWPDAFIVTGPAPAAQRRKPCERRHKEGWSQGGADGSPLGRRAGERLDRLLTELDVAHDVKIYPGAGHGFMNDHDPADATLLLRLLARISGTKYDAEATRDAFPRHTSAWSTRVAPTS